MAHEQEQSNKNKLRYNVGEKIYGIHFAFEGMKIPTFRMPFLYDNVPISKISIIELTVKEHHKVRWEYELEGTEPKYDGFILEDKDGNIWYNQYPVAHYGQLSDDGDRCFIRQKAKDSSSQESLIDNDVRIINLINDVFYRINQGICDLCERKDQLKQNEAVPATATLHLIELLEECKANIMKIFKNDFGKTFKEVAIHKDYPTFKSFEVCDLGDENAVM